MQKLLLQANIDYQTLSQQANDIYLQRDVPRNTSMRAPNELLEKHKDKIVTAFAHSQFIKKVALQYPQRFIEKLNIIDEAFALTSNKNTLLTTSFYQDSYQSLTHTLAELAQTNSTIQSLEIQAGIAIRQFRQLQMMTIAFFDIHKLQTIETSLLAVSHLANHIIIAANTCLFDALCKRYGAPQHNQPLLILAMGKLGGNELNFSSDIDLIFTYPEKGETQALAPGKQTVEHQVFFTRLAQKLIAMLDQITQDGFAYRVDMRLRPMGDSGPLVLPFSAFEGYYQEQGRQWERFAMQKMRIVNDTPYNNALYSIIRPFVYRKYIDFTTIESIREMKLLIEKEVRRRQISHNIKLGQGGIREVEFFIQSLQLIHAGRHPQCQHNSIILSMQALQEAHLTGDVDMKQLKSDYLYLRQVEHYLQIFNDEQTQTLPFLDGSHNKQSTYVDMARLCSLLGNSVFSASANVIIDETTNPTTNATTEDLAAIRKDFADLSKTINACMGRIHDVFNSIVDDANVPAVSQPKAINDTKAIADNADTAINALLSQALDDIWQLSLDKPEAIAVLEDILDDATAATFVEHIFKFKKRAQRTGVSERAQQSINRLMPLLLSELLIINGEFNNEVFDDQAKGVFDILQTICGRVTYIDLLLEHPEVRARLLFLCKKSVWVAQQIAQYPILLDELLHPVYLDHNELSLPQYKEQCADQLRQFMLRVDSKDEEQVMDRLREFKHTNQLRIAAADIAGTLAINQVSDKLTLLAEVIMQTVIDLAWLQITTLFGQPTQNMQKSPQQNAQHTPNQLALVAYGKFGGIELSYGSDLDVVFLHNADLSLQTDATGSRKTISNQEFYIKLVQRVCHICSTKTYNGILYDIDLRLRPSGNSGLLVSHIDTFLHYQDTVAWTWEHQALVRSRVVVGTESLYKQFEDVRTTILCKKRNQDELKQQVFDMRMKMRKHLEVIKPNQVDIKQTKGGIVDVEFMVQLWVLANAHKHPEITVWSDNLRLLNALFLINEIDKAQLETLTNAYLTLRQATHRVQLANRSLARGGDQISKKLLSSLQEVSRMFEQVF